jgi:hypothetical protein
LLGYLSAVPVCDDPDGVFSDAIENSVGLDVDLAVWEIGRFKEDRPTGGIVTVA